MKVLNVKNVDEIECNCGCWIKHWEKHTGDQSGFCMASGCFKSDIVGAQVIKDVDYDDACYVVPLCREHNSKNKPVKLQPKVKLAPARKGSCCD